MALLSLRRVNAEFKESYLKVMMRCGSFLLHARFDQMLEETVLSESGSNLCVEEICTCQPGKG